MPGNERLLIPNTPHHLVRRTRKGKTIFITEEHYTKCIEDIKDLARAYGILIHAWTLLPDRIHLIVTPGKDPTVLSTFMKALICRITLRYRRYCETQDDLNNIPKNKRKKHIKIWDNRYLSSPVEPGQWLLAAICFMEKLPAVMGYALSAFRYPYSSYRMRRGKTEEYWLDDPEEYTRLGEDVDERGRAFGTYMRIGLETKERRMIDTAVTRGRLTGSERFVEMIRKEYNIYAPNRGPGRPRKQRNASKSNKSSKGGEDGQNTDQNATDKGKGAGNNGQNTDD